MPPKAQPTLGVALAGVTKRFGSKDSGVLALDRIDLTIRDGEFVAVDEPIGIARAAKAAGMPCVVSFTLETDGRLLSGLSVAEAIRMVDAATGRSPLYYMINCAHPAHFDRELQGGEDWLSRIGGIRANASTRSHAELDESETLDEGDPRDLGRRYGALMQVLPNIKVLGGCCGTDHRHLAEISAACLTPAA